MLHSLSEYLPECPLVEPGCYMKLIATNEVIVLVKSSMDVNFDSYSKPKMKVELC